MNSLAIAATATALILMGSSAAAQQPTAVEEQSTTSDPQTVDPAAPSEKMPMPMAHDKMPMPMKHDNMPMPNTSTTVESTLDAAPDATGAAMPASVTTTVVANAPIPDTAENRAKYGAPMSNAGKRTAARGN